MSVVPNQNLVKNRQYVMSMEQHFLYRLFRSSKFFIKIKSVKQELFPKQNQKKPETHRFYFQRRHVMAQVLASWEIPLRHGRKIPLNFQWHPILSDTSF